MSKPFPGLDVPIGTVNGQPVLMSQTWYEYFQGIQKLSQLPDVSTTAPTNGQVLTWVVATGKWTPAAN